MLLDINCEHASQIERCSCAVSDRCAKCKEDAKKILFMCAALRDTVSFDRAKELPDGVADAIEWIAHRSAQDIMAHRESIICEIEEHARQLRASGACDEWFAGADSGVRRLAGGVNGPLLAELARITQFHDCPCVNMFRFGCKLMGLLDRSGNGTQVSAAVHESIDALMHSAADRNHGVLRALKEGEYSGHLLDITSTDAALHRMTPPVIINAGDTFSDINIAQRFAVAQGIKADGQQKIRAVDDETRAGVNGCSAASEKLRVDNTDMLFEVVRLFISLVGLVPDLWKSDIDSAFRRIPLRPQDRWAAFVAFIANGRMYISGHLAAPFGALSSVHNWDRIGSLLAHLARRLLFLPVLRYVDDFFACESAETIEHALNCFKRLVRVLLGDDAVAEHKCMSGNPLEILGLTISLSSWGMACIPAALKISKWLAWIDEALATLRLAPGLSSKLAGALCWAGRCCGRCSHNKIDGGTLWACH